MQVTLAHAELEVLHQPSVLHYVQRIKHVVAKVARNNKQVLHAFPKTARRAHVVVAVGSAQCAVLRVLQNGGRKRVKREKVSQVLFAIFHHERLNNIIARHEKVFYFFLGVNNAYFDVLKEVSEQLVNSFHVRLYHRPHPFNLLLVWQFESLQIASQRRAGWQSAELHIYEFFGVQRSVPVSRVADWRGKSDACRVHCRPSVSEVDSSSDFLDQHRCEALGPQLLVHTKEVDFCHFNPLSIQLHSNRDAGDKAEKPLFFASTDTNKPFFWLTWRQKCPSQERDRVIKPKCLTLVLNIVLSEQVVQF